MDEQRAEELLRERARRRGAEPLGEGSSARLLGDLREERDSARGRLGPRLVFRSAVGVLTAAAAVVAAFFLFASEPPRDYGALPLELALLDSAGRPLDVDPTARGPANDFVRPSEVLIEVVPGAPATSGFWWTFVYDPSGRRHAGRADRVAAPGLEVPWSHALDGYAALDEGDSLVTVVAIGAVEELPRIGELLPGEIGSGPDRRRALDVAAERIEARFGCSVTVRELVLERSP